MAKESKKVRQRQKALEQRVKALPRNVRIKIGMMVLRRLEEEAQERERQRLKIQHVHDEHSLWGITKNLATVILALIIVFGPMFLFSYLVGPRKKGQDEHGL